MKNFNEVVADEVKGVKGCQFFFIKYVSSPTLNKAQKLAISVLGGFSEIVEITKVVEGEFHLNYNYGNVVNKRGEREQGHEIEFVAGPLPWGQWVEGAVNKLIENKGELYLRYYCLNDKKVKTTYYVGGKLATDEQANLIKEFTPENKSKKQAEAGLTENQVMPRNVKMDNIREITLNGATYTRK